MRTIATFSFMRNRPRLLSKHKFVEIIFRNSQNKYDLNGLTVYSLDDRLRYGVQLLDSRINFTDFNSTARGRTQCIRYRRKIWSRFSVYWSTLCAQHSTIIIKLFLIQCSGSHIQYPHLTISGLRLLSLL